MTRPASANPLRKSWEDAKQRALSARRASRAKRELAEDVDEGVWRRHAQQALDNSRWNHRNDPPSDSPELALLGLLTDDQLLEADRRVPMTLLTTPVRLLKIDQVTQWKSLPVYEEIPASACVEVPYNEMDDQKWSSVCMVSWRWPEMKPTQFDECFSPMPTEQLVRLQKTLKKRAIEDSKALLWVDWCCAPQYTSDPLVEIARSRLFYAKAATLLVIPEFKSTRPAGMVKEALGSLTKSLGRRRSSLSSNGTGYHSLQPQSRLHNNDGRPSTSICSSTTPISVGLERQRSRSMDGLTSNFEEGTDMQVPPLPTISPAPKSRNLSRFAPLRRFTASQAVGPEATPAKQDASHSNLRHNATEEFRSPHPAQDALLISGQVALPAMQPRPRSASTRGQKANISLSPRQSNPQAIQQPRIDQSASEQTSGPLNPTAELRTTEVLAGSRHAESGSRPHALEGTSHSHMTSKWPGSISTTHQGSSEVSSLSLSPRQTESQAQQAPFQLDGHPNIAEIPVKTKTSEDDSEPRMQDYDNAEKMVVHHTSNGQHAEVMKLHHANSEANMLRSDSMTGNAAGMLLQSLPSNMMIERDDPDYQLISKPVPPPKPPSRDGPKPISPSGFTPVQNRPRTNQGRSRPGTGKPSTPNKALQSGLLSPKQAQNAPPSPRTGFSLGALQPAVIKSRPESIAPPSTAAPSWVKKITGRATTVEAA